MDNQVEQKAIFTTDEDSKFIDKRRSNTKSDLIEITEDKLENILLKHLEKLTNKKSWQAPLSAFASILLADLTSNFTKKFGIEGSTWEALFLLLSIASAGWLVCALLNVIALKGKGTISELVLIIKNAEPKN
jgi:hypothetical protein